MNIKKPKERGLCLLADTELAHCKTCGRVGVPMKEQREGSTFLVCKCGEETEEDCEHQTV